MPEGKIVKNIVEGKNMSFLDPGSLNFFTNQEVVGSSFLPTT